MPSEPSKDEKKTKTPKVIAPITSFENHWFFRMPKESRDELMGFFKDMLALIRGKVDVKSRLMLLMDPDNVLTSSRLSPSQVRFVAGSVWVAEEFPIFKPLADYAETFALTGISRGGLGREESIRFVQALQEARTISRAVKLEEVGKSVEA